MQPTVKTTMSSNALLERLRKRGAKGKKKDILHRGLRWNQSRAPALHEQGKFMYVAKFDSKGQERKTVGTRTLGSLVAKWQKNAEVDILVVFNEDVRIMGTEEDVLAATGKNALPKEWSVLRRDDFQGDEDDEDRIAQNLATVQEELNTALNSKENKSEDDLYLLKLLALNHMMGTEMWTKRRREKGHVRGTAWYLFEKSKTMKKQKRVAVGEGGMFKLSKLPSDKAPLNTIGKLAFTDKTTLKAFQEALLKEAKTSDQKDQAKGIQSTLSKLKSRKEGDA